MKEYRLKKFEESIFLVGFMASGKSTIGKQIAHILEKPFIDLDEYIIKKEGSSVSDIFKKYSIINLQCKLILIFPECIKLQRQLILNHPIPDASFVPELNIGDSNVTGTSSILQ